MDDSNDERPPRGRKPGAGRAPGGPRAGRPPGPPRRPRPDERPAAGRDAEPARPRSKAGPEGARPARAGAGRPPRDGGREDRPRGPGAARPRPPFAKPDQPARGDAERGGERHARRFERDDAPRPPRGAGRDERPPFGRPGRPARGDAGPGAGERPARRFARDGGGGPSGPGGSDRPRGPGGPRLEPGAGERPVRRFAREDEARPARPRPAGEGRPEWPAPRGRAPAPAPDAPATDAPDARPRAIERIAKVMARAGLCSRRDAEAWIEAGRVAVNGRVLRSAAINVGPNDRVEVDGQPLPERERTRLWRYHKPAGLMTTAFDPEGRPTVFGALPSELPRVVTVGRLDINTEGLLLLTNDGGLARVLAHPETGWIRRYRVRVHGQVSQEALDALRPGVTIDGIHYGPIEARIDREQGSNVWITMDLREGKNREVKRVFEHLGASVNRLIRISFGPFQLGDLPEGAVEEVRQRHLREQLGHTLAEEAGVDFEAPLRGAHEERMGARGARARDPRREEPDEPVRRIEVGTTADRRGRTVRVERITSAGEAAPTIRRTTRGEREGAGREREEAGRGREAGRGGAAPRRAPGGDQPLQRPQRREESGAERSGPPRGRGEGFGPRRAPAGERPMRASPRHGESEERSSRPARREGEAGRGGFGAGRPPRDREFGAREGGAGRDERGRPRGPSLHSRPPTDGEERPARRFGVPGGERRGMREPGGGREGRPARDGGREDRPGRGAPRPQGARPGSGPRAGGGPKPGTSRPGGPPRGKAGGPKPSSGPRTGGGSGPPRGPRR